MTPSTTIIDSPETLPLHEFTEKAYLDYSMYVILDRALPHVGDGLKPVQRRIIYAMSELGLSAAAKFKKSARTVGDVLGKFHPHGDSACYEAMVLMAQSFSFRYPLVDGQGNWGSSDDPKSFAAMRYTEAKLTPYAATLLSELEQGTVDWTPNFDGTLDEPKLLPARLPNLLLNGTTGIAVGMATDIPPHNLTEVVNACIHLLDHPDASLKDICKYIKGPDFPTCAEIITPPKDITNIYRIGTGSIRMRAVYTIEEGEIIVTALPHQTSGTKVLEQIAAQMQAKKLPMVSDLRDESDHENPTRFLITPRSNRIDIDALMSHLFATTDLERSYRVNLNIIGIDERPQVKPLLIFLKEWLNYRTETVRRRLAFRLEKVEARLHILDGLLIAYLNIDEIIRIIRNEDKPKTALIKHFNLSAQQAEAILELKLRHLASLEEIKIRTEQEELSKERNWLVETLGSETLLTKLIRTELKTDGKKFGDARRSPIVVRSEAQSISEEQMIPAESVTVILSEKGWVRSAKGHEVDSENLSYKTGDHFLVAAMGRSNQSAFFLDSTGRSYAVSAHTLPSARGQGEPITSRLKPPAGAHFLSVLMGEENDLWLLASDAGYGFVVTLSDLYTKNRQGKAVLKLPKGAHALTPSRITNLDEQYIAAITNIGKMLLFPLTDLPTLSRGKGNKIIQISPAKVAEREEYVTHLIVLKKQDKLVLHADKQALKLAFKDLVHYQGERGRRGNNLPRAFKHVDRVTIA